uniref:Ovule protein n=1 Tax=Syphacia muris TaxID=451379 RepID=A0A0N5AL25_9BILA
MGCCIKQVMDYGTKTNAHCRCSQSAVYRRTNSGLSLDYTVSRLSHPLERSKNTLIFSSKVICKQINNTTSISFTRQTQ